MKRRLFLSLIRAAASFLAVAIEFGNLCLAKNTGVVEKMTVPDGGRPRRIDAPLGTPEGVGRAGAFGVVLEASERALLRATAIKLAEFKRGLSCLAMIGSAAPLVGLFGTALCLIDTVATLNDSASAGFLAFAGGIADALLTTAAGLAVGIPVVWLFNYFTNQVDNFAVEMDDASAELTSFFIKQCGKKYV